MSDIFLQKCVLLAVLLILFSASPAGPDEIPEYRIAAVSWIGWSPLQVAESKGFWKTRGINVEVVLYDNPGIIVEAMKAKQIDLAMDMIGSIAATSADYPGCIPEGIWTFADTLEAIPGDDVIALLLGWLDAVEWIGNEENREEYLQIVNSEVFPDFAEYDHHELLTMLGMVRIHDVPESVERNRTNGGLFEFLIAMRGFLAETGTLNREFKPSNIFNNSYISEALELIYE